MLNVSQPMTADAIKSYFKGGHDYYVNGEDLPGIWGGKLSHELGLHGEITKEQFDRMADGLHPWSGDKLKPGKRETNRAGNDITISAPKEFSLLYLAGTSDERKQLERAFVESCDWVMGEAEKLTATRVNIGGVQPDRHTGNWAYAGFLQFDSRPDANTQLPVIQIHRHHTVFNLTNDPEERRIKALQLGIVKGNADLLMPMFHNELAKRVREMGLGVKRVGKVGFGIEGVPRSLVEKWSPRRQTILEAKERIAKKEGITDPERLRRLQAELAVLTRMHKQKDLGRGELWKHWERQLTQDDRAVLAAAWDRQGWQTSNADALAFALEHLSEKKAVFPEKQLLIEGLRYGMGSVTADGLKAEYDRQGVMLVNGNVTTAKTWAEEQFILDFAEQGKATVRPAMEKGRTVETMRPLVTGAGAGYRAQYVGLEDRHVSINTSPAESEFPNLVNDLATLSAEQQAEDESLQRGDPKFTTGGGADHFRDLTQKLDLSAEQQAKTVTLTDEQQAAVSGLLQSSDRVNIVDAGQGTGKTTMLEHYGMNLSRLGVKATWLGTTHTAVDQLQARGLPAMTVAHFLKSKAEQQKASGGRIIVDEASMLSHRDNYDLFAYARANQCRVDLVGDSKQYKSPSAGDPMGLLTKYAHLKPLTMTKTMRQKGRLKEAMESIRAGKELKAHAILTDLDMVHVVPAAEIAQRAADRYLEWSKGGQFVPCVSPTHAQASDIAARIRAGLRARGDIKGPDHHLRRLVNLGWSKAELKDAKARGAEGVVLTPFAAYSDELQDLAVGDQVKTTMAGTSLDGHQLKNGQRYSIKAFTEEGNPVLNNGWVVDKDWGGLVQRYVMTGQGAQGLDARRGIVVYGTPSLVATRQEGYYVPVSRVQKEVAVFTDDVKMLQAAIQRRENRESATQLIGRVVTKAKKATFMQRARAYYDRLREAGRELVNELGRNLAYER